MKESSTVKDDYLFFHTAATPALQVGQIPQEGRAKITAGQVSCSLLGHLPFKSNTESTTAFAHSWLLSRHHSLLHPELFQVLICSHNGLGK